MILMQFMLCLSKKKREKKWDNGWKKVYGLVGQ